MRKVIEILYIDKKVSKSGRRYAITTALLDDGTEAEYFGEGLRMQDEVEVFFHYGKVKCRKPGDKRA